MVWTPAPVSAVYTAGVVPAAVHGISAHPTTATAAAISTQLHGPVVTGPILSPAAVATAAATPAQGFRSPRKTKTTPLSDDTPSSGSASGSVNVGGRTFERLRELGKGSFGVVWEVQESSPSVAGDSKGCSGPLALKCSKPANQQMLEACQFEAEVLQRLAAALPEEVAKCNRVPRYIAHCTSHSTSASPTKSLSGAALAASLTGKSQVLVAMSKLEGRPLDQWLYGVDENRLKTVSLTQVLEGPFPDGTFASRSLADACATTTALLEQLAPVFTPLDGIAYHRDVSAHNFLFREEAGAQHFALLDFGLAVRAPTWQHEYQSRNISGDPRYFTPAAWMLMVYGHKYLEAHPDSSFLEQYKRRMDHYSMGLLALEVLFSLWRGPAAETEARADSEEREAAAAAAGMRALSRVRGAWRALWTDAVKFFQLFHAKGFAATRETLARSQGVSKYADKLRTLCTELRSVAAEIAADAALASVLDIAAGLLDPRASLEWRDLLGLLRPREAPPVEGQAAEAPREEERVPEAGAGEGHHSEAVEAAPVEPAVENAAAAANECSSTANAEADLPLRPVRKFSHRRNWTVDEAVSLTRGVREVGMGWGALPGMPEDGASSVAALQDGVSPLSKITDFRDGTAQLRQDIKSFGKEGRH